MTTLRKSSHLSAPSSLLFTMLPKTTSKLHKVYCPHCNQLVTAAAAERHLSALNFDTMLKSAHRIACPARCGPAGRRLSDVRRQSLSPNGACVPEDAPMADVTGGPLQPPAQPAGDVPGPATPSPENSKSRPTDADGIDWQVLHKALAAAAHLHPGARDPQKTRTGARMQTTAQRPRRKRKRKRRTTIPRPTFGTTCCQGSWISRWTTMTVSTA
jgi:hypothetical protein